ncbi:MAG: TipAS antibiotic-recognition domain-containing protein [Chloroflexota bacterium]
MTEPIYHRQSDQEIEDNARSARLQYDPDTVRESMNRWNSYTDDQQQAIIDEGNAIYDAFAEALRAEKPATDPEVREIVERWHEHTRNFYEPSLDVMRGLAEMYRTDVNFSTKFAALHADLPEYLHTAIDDYVDDLETTEIQRMLDEDNDRANDARSRLSS